MPYIRWQRKRLGQGGDRRLGLLKLQSRMHRGFVLFPARDRACALGCISSWAGKCLRCAQEKLACGNSLGAWGKNLGARGKSFGRAREQFRRAPEGFVIKNPEMCSLISALRRSSNRGRLIPGLMALDREGASECQEEFD